MNLSKSISLFTLSFSSLTQMAYSSISVYLSPPDVENAEESWLDDKTLTETFSEQTISSSATISSSIIGAYTGDFDVKGNDQYGGHEEGNYFSVAAGDTATLTFNTDVNYFGLYFTAGNAGNTFEVVKGGQTILSFNTAELLGLLEGPTIAAINGTVYDTQDYYGQPGTNSNGAEPYAYLHIVASGGQTFDEIRLSEVGGNAAFESDNHSIRTTSTPIPDTLINVSGTVVPEPTALGLLFSGSLLSLVLRRRR